MEILENHPDISLVWGLCQYISENGSPGLVANAGFFDNPPPQGKEFIYYWLKEKPLFPEGNLCVRKRVLEECLPSEASPDERPVWLSFNYNFNTSGYIPFFVPVVANYHRTRLDFGGLRPLVPGGGTGYLPYFVPLAASNAAGEPEAIADESWQESLAAYYDNVQKYRKLLIKGKTVHCYRNGGGEALPCHLRRSWLLFGNKLPVGFRQALNYWGKTVFKRVFGTETTMSKYDK